MTPALASAPMAGGIPVPPRRPTVLHLRASGGLFGADRVVLDLCIGLAAGGYRAVLVPLLEPDGTGSTLRAAAEDCGIPVRVLPLQGRLDLRGGVSLLRRLAAVEGAEILHGHDYKANTLIHLARVAKTFRVATLHGRVGTDWKLRLYESFESHLVRRFDRVICVSEPMRAAETGRGFAPVFIPNGIDIAPFTNAPAPTAELRADLGLPPAAAVIGSIGRLSAEKGLDTLLAAAARLVPSVPNLHVLLVGDGTERTRLVRYAAELGLADRVHFAGVRADTPALHRLLDVFCLPSWHEGLPLALLEALATGTAAVVTPVGGVQDVLATEHKEGHPVALTFTPGDVAELASHLGQLLAEPELRRRLGAAGRGRVATHFSRSVMARATAALYDELRRAGPAGEGHLPPA